MAASLESIRSTVTAQTVTSPVGVEVMANRRGTYRGEGVRASSENSKLNAPSPSTESRISNAGRMDARSLQIKQARQGQAAHSNALSRIADYLDKLPDMPSAERLQSLAQEFEREMIDGPPLHLTEHVGKHVAERIVEREVATRDTGAEERAGREDAPGGDPAGGDTPGREGRGASGNALSRPEWMREMSGRFLQQLQRFDGDVTHQFAALELMTEHFEQIGADEPFLQALGEARQQFEQGDIARDVRAGFAAAKVAHEAAATLETDPATVRNGYRALLREQTNLGGLFEKLATFDLANKYETVIETFLTAAGRDLATTDGQTDKILLNGLLQELSKLKTMQTVLEQSKSLVGTALRYLERREHHCLDAVRLTGDMLHFAAKTTPTPKDVRQLLGPCELDPEVQVLVGNGLRALHGQLPDMIIPGSQARILQAAAIMGLLGQLVELEEAAHAARSG